MTTVNSSTRKSWPTITDRIRTQARDAYNRELSLHKRIKYVQGYLMAKVWYDAQIFPPTDDCVRKLNTSISWFIWKGDIFRVPLSTLQKTERRRRLGINKPTGKEPSILPLPDADGDTTAQWMKKWNPTEQSTNPPFRERIRAALGYLRRLEIESAYVAPQGHTESRSAYKRRIYATMQSILRAISENRETRITKLWPQANWKVVWKNLHETPVPKSSRAAWHRVIRGLEL